jgi:hypothetical protein
MRPRRVAIPLGATGGRQDMAFFGVTHAAEREGTVAPDLEPVHRAAPDPMQGLYRALGNRSLADLGGAVTHQPDGGLHLGPDPAPTPAAQAPATPAPAPATPTPAAPASAGPASAPAASTVPASASPASVPAAPTVPASAGPASAPTVPASAGPASAPAAPASASPASAPAAPTVPASAGPASAPTVPASAGPASASTVPAPAGPTSAGPTSAAPSAPATSAPTAALPAPVVTTDVPHPPDPPQTAAMPALDAPLLAKLLAGFGMSPATVAGWLGDLPLPVDSAAAYWGAPEVGTYVDTLARGWTTWLTAAKRPLDPLLRAELVRDYGETMEGAFARLSVPGVRVPGGLAAPFSQLPDRIRALLKKRLAELTRKGGPDEAVIAELITFRQRINHAISSYRNIAAWGWMVERRQHLDFATIANPKVKPIWPFQPAALPSAASCTTTRRWPWPSTGSWAANASPRSPTPPGTRGPMPSRTSTGTVLSSSTSTWTWRTSR